MTTLITHTKTIEIQRKLTNVIVGVNERQRLFQRVQRHDEFGACDHAC
jgi:hypothetical protein